MVKKFQNIHKLKPDGIIDQSLYGIMMEQLCKRCKYIEKDKLGK
jgi:hypothetical protein